MLFEAVRADIIFKVMPVFCRVTDIKCECVLFTGSIEIMQSAKSFTGIHRNTFGSERSEMSHQVHLHTGKVCSGFFHIPLAHRDCHVLFLQDPIRIHRLIQNDLVILVPIRIQSVSSIPHQNRVLKIRSLHMMVIDRNLGTCSAIQAVQKFRVCKKHAFLILSGGHQVIDIRELPALSVFASDKENTIRPDSLDGYDILHLLRNFVTFFVCFQDVTDRFHHGPYKPPSHAKRSDLSSPHSNSCWIQI